MNRAIYLSSFDGFSWKRVGMMMNYFFTRLSKKMIIFFSAALLLIALLAVTAALGEYGATSFTVSVLTYLTCFSPLLFAAMRGQRLFLTMPALGAEKFTACLLIVGFIFPIAIFGIAFLAVLAASGENLFAILADAMQQEAHYTVSVPLYAISSLLSNFGYTMFVLWIVMQTSTHRILKAIVIPLAVSFLFGMVLSIILVVVGFIDGFNNCMTSDSFIRITVIKTVFSLGFVYYVAETLFCSIMAYRAICRKQL